MTMIDESTRAVASIARSLASEHPDKLLPCPVCCDAVPASELDGHLRAVHELSSATPGQMTGWTVIDRGVRPYTLVPIVLSLVGFGLVVYGFEDEQIELALGIFLVVFTLSWVPGVLAVYDKLNGRITVEDNALRVSHVFGLRTKRVTFPVSIETGRLEDTREGAMAKDGAGYRGVSKTVDMGSYVRLTGANGATVILGAATGGLLEDCWDMDGVERGETRRWWDVNLETAHMVGLQYVLASHGALTPNVFPRAQDGAPGAPSAPQ